jgi:MoaA/NifB/PqqE/SkfB family radical SAM enzyme
MNIIEWFSHVVRRTGFIRVPRVIKKLGFDVVHGCQLRCIGCPNSTIEPKIQFISIEDFTTCLNNIDVEEVRTFRMFNFGEPLLHPKLPELVTQVRRFGFRVKNLEISTNGQCHDFERLAKVFETGQLNMLVVSCDGNATAEEYERLRPPATWGKLITFLEKARMLRDRYGQNVTLMTRSICTDPEDQQRWTDILVPLGWSPQFRDWLALPRSLGKRSKSEQLRKASLCPYMSSTEHLYVDIDGTVVPCCAHPRAFVFGNLKIHKFSEIISGSLREDMITMMERGRYGLPICMECGL